MIKFINGNPIELEKKHNNLSDDGQAIKFPDMAICHSRRLDGIGQSGQRRLELHFGSKWRLQQRENSAKRHLMKMVQKSSSSLGSLFFLSIIPNLRIEPLGLSWPQEGILAGWTRFFLFRR